MPAFEWFGGSKETELEEIKTRVFRNNERATFDNEVVFTDVEGMDVKETRLVLNPDNPEEIDDWATAWFKFIDQDGAFWVRIDPGAEDSENHGVFMLGEDEW